MAKNYQHPGFRDNYGYTTHGIDDDERTKLPPLEPAPRQWIPRIITGSEPGGKKPPASPPSTYGTGDIFSSPSQPRFKLPVYSDPIATVGQPDANDNDGGDAEDAEGRDTWDNPIEFLLSCISMSVGLGNVWRFPGVAARNGGGAFLIPYLVVLLLIGRPLYYLEMCMGQFSRYGQVKVWNMAPMFKGVGYGSIIGVISTLSYYCALMAITVYFFIASFAKTLPWSVCHQEKHENINCSYIVKNEAAFYYRYTVNPQRDDIDDGLGKISWQLTLCLAFSWFLIFLTLVRGVKSSGKVAYFTAIFPYVVLIVLLIRGVTLPGAWMGIRQFLEPQWKEILKPDVWYAAVEQCFFSLTAGFGPIIMYSSYNNFKQDIYRDSIIISFMDTFTSLLAGVTIFAVIGNLMETQGLTFAELQPSIRGPELAFILYPQAIASFTWVPQLFAVLFFLMLFTLGIGSATSLTGGVITIICDQFPSWKRWLVTLVVCVIGCALGLMYVSEGGMMMLDLIDHYGAGFIIYVMAMIECAAISYVYGLSNFCNDVEFMIGRNPGIYYRFCWAILLPLGLLAVLLYYLITSGEFKYGDVAYPQIATICGWLLTAFAVGLVPAWGLHAVLTRKASTIKEKFVLALKPTDRWGPQTPRLRNEWQSFRAKKETDGSRKRFFIF